MKWIFNLGLSGLVIVQFRILLFTSNTLGGLCEAWPDFGALMFVIRRWEVYVGLRLSCSKFSSVNKLWHFWIIIVCTRRCRVNRSVSSVSQKCHGTCFGGHIHNKNKFRLAILISQMTIWRKWSLPRSSLLTSPYGLEYVTYSVQV